MTARTIEAGARGGAPAPHTSLLPMSSASDGGLQKWKGALMAGYPPPSPRVSVGPGYILAAVATLGLYVSVIAYPIGVIVNVALLLAAGRDTERLGYEPDGTGCLGTLAAVFIVIPLLLGAIALALYLFA